MDSPSSIFMTEGEKHTAGLPGNGDGLNDFKDFFLPVDFGIIPRKNKNRLLLCLWFTRR